MRLCKGVIHIFQALFKEASNEEENQIVNVFQSLKNTMKVLFSLSKEKKFDRMFVEENLINDLVTILTKYFIEGEDQIKKLTSKKIV